jgi:hypothetical protein
VTGVDRGAALGRRLFLALSARAAVLQRIKPKHAAPVSAGAILPAGYQCMGTSAGWPGPAPEITPAARHRSGLPGLQ